MKYNVLTGSIILPSAVRIWTAVRQLPIPAVDGKQNQNPKWYSSNKLEHYNSITCIGNINTNTQYHMYSHSMSTFVGISALSMQTGVYSFL
jgi:hypothetical protein